MRINGNNYKLIPIPNSEDDQIVNLTGPTQIDDAEKIEIDFSRSASSKKYSFNIYGMCKFGEIKRRYNICGEVSYVIINRTCQLTTAGFLRIRDAQYAMFDGTSLTII